jgi:hypothetical protein
MIVKLGCGKNGRKNKKSGFSKNPDFSTLFSFSDRYSLSFQEIAALTPETTKHNANCYRRTRGWDLRILVRLLR